MWTLSIDHNNACLGAMYESRKPSQVFGDGGGVQYVEVSFSRIDYDFKGDHSSSGRGAGQNA